MNRDLKGIEVLFASHCQSRNVLGITSPVDANVCGVCALFLHPWQTWLIYHSTTTITQPFC